MSRITVIGGTGFAGQAIAKEALKRGHDVAVVSRKQPAEAVDGITYIQGSIVDEATRHTLLDQSDVIVCAAAPRGDMEGQLKPAYLALADEAAGTNVSLVIVGGFSSLRPAAGQPRYFESGDVPAEYMAEATEVAGVFDSLNSNDAAGAHWVFISPAATFGAWANIPDTGTYRVSDDVALFDSNNESKISANDFALGVLDEIENPQHDRQNIGLVQ